MNGNTHFTKEIINKSPTLVAYKNTMGRILNVVLHDRIDPEDIDDALNYSIIKRIKNPAGSIDNSYTHKKVDIDALSMADYIAKRQPIITSYGVLFKKHADVPNPMGRVVQEFMDSRQKYKNTMLTLPKGSEDFEKYNLLQLLEKQNANAIYGLIGLYMSIVYNSNVAPSITSMGRSLISSAICCFESFLSNSVQFGSVDEVLTFIDNVRLEEKDWKYNDLNVLDRDKWIDIGKCFTKLMMTCGFQWMPDTEDMEIIWDTLTDCSPIELNRIYYKNNLYEFMDNSICRNLMIKIFTEMDRPYMAAKKVPKSIKKDLDALRDLLLEYVFYNHQVMDRMIRNKVMIKNISLISDTDSSFVSLDAWYRYNINYLKDYDFPILHQTLDVVNYCEQWEKDHDGEWIDPTYKTLAFKPIDGKPINAITFEDPILDYDFYKDEIIEQHKAVDALKYISQDNMRFALINIMAYILDSVINLNMLDFTKQSHSYRGDPNCKIIMKNEFFMTRVLLTDVKKNYASLQKLQEGKYLGDEGYLDVKGIECMTKSTSPDSTKKRLKKILLEDILLDKPIDQYKILKDMAITEKQIYNDLISGNKTYYRPLVIKSVNHYKDPLSEQGIKSAAAWNYVKDPDLPALDLNDRNAVDIAKIDCTVKTIEAIHHDYPEVYKRFYELLDISNPINVMENGDSPITNADLYKNGITSIAIPKDTAVPKWLMPLIDFQQIVSDNISGFPLQSVGISKLDNRTGINYTNILKL